VAERRARAGRSSGTAQRHNPNSLIANENPAQNPFYEPFDLLFAQLLAHEEVLGLAQRALADIGRVPTPAAEAQQGSGPDRFPGFVADIRTLQEKRYVRLLPTYRVPERTDEAHELAARNLLRRCCNWIVQDSYESFRAFVCSIDRELSRVGASSPSERIPALRTFLAVGKTVLRARPARDDIRTRLKAVRKAAPSLVLCEKENARALNLQAWIAVVRVARNAIVHGDGGFVSPKQLRRVDRMLLEKTFPGTHVSGRGYVIELTPDTARDVIERLREYGLAIYSAASATVGAEAHMLGPDRIITKWRR
jgi:hypothetical protein